MAQCRWRRRPTLYCSRCAVLGHGGRGEGSCAFAAGSFIANHLRQKQPDLVRHGDSIQAVSGATRAGRAGCRDQDVARATLKSVLRRYRLSLGRYRRGGAAGSSGGRRDRGGIRRILHAALMHVPIGSLGGEAHRSDQDRHGKSNKHGHDAAPVAGKPARAPSRRGMPPLIGKSAPLSASSSLFLYHTRHIPFTKLAIYPLPNSLRAMSPQYIGYTYYFNYSFR
jgi:hypothetical protein